MSHIEPKTDITPLFVNQFSVATPYLGMRVFVTERFRGEAGDAMGVSQGFSAWDHQRSRKSYSSGGVGWSTEEPIGWGTVVEVIPDVRDGLVCGFDGLVQLDE